MEQEHEFSDRLNDLERSLGELQPATARLDVAQTMFLAGQVSAKRRYQIVWPTLSACLALVSLSLAVLLINQQDARIAGSNRDMISTDASDEGRRAEQLDRETASDDRNPSNERNALPSSSSDTMEGQEEWQDPLEQLLRQRLALLGQSDADASTSLDDEQVTFDAMRYDDWRTMLDTEERVDSLSPIYQFGPFRWIDLFHARGI